MKKFYIILIIVLSISGCKSRPNIYSVEIKKLNTKKLIKNLEKSRFSSKLFESRFSIKYQGKNQRFSGGGKIKILKDSIIWGSINFMGIPGAKFMLTPSKIQYYNKVEQTYYAGNYQSISNLIGIDLNFYQIQNLLFADVISKPKTNEYEISFSSKYYELNAAKSKLINRIKINSFFKVIFEKVQSGDKSLDISYDKFIQLKDEILPTNIRIKAENKQQNLLLNLDFNKPIIGKPTRYPFKIPDNYTKMN